MKAAITTILVMAGILAVGVMGANPTMIERLKIGGGYGSSGVDIDQDGNVSADGDLLVDGVVKAGSTPVTLTAADGKLLHAAIQQNSASSGQVLKWNGSAWAPAADTDTDTTYTAGTGLLLSTTQFSLQHLGLETLTDPGADRLYMWDESAGTGGQSAWVTLGTNLAFDGATLNATDTDTTYSDFTGDSGAGGAAGLVPAPGAGDTAAGKYLKASGGWATPPDTNTTYSAGTGLNLATTTFSLSHLGIQSLSDPGADRILFWDESENASKWLTIGTNLEISGTTLNASASAGITNFTLAGDSGTPQTISDGNTLTISGSGGITAVAGATDKVTIGLPSGSSGQVLKHNGSAWVAGTDTDTTYTAFTGDSGAGGAAGLVPAPGAGDTAAGKYLKASGGWATPPDTNTTYSAGTGLNLATTTFSLSHLGIQSLTDPDDDRIFFWDDGEGAAKWLDIGTNLEISGTTLNATGGGSLPSGSEHQTLRYDDPNGWEAAANLTNTGTYVTVIGTGADVQPLDIYHATNAAADSEVHISFSSADPDGNATPTIGTVGFEIEAVTETDILDADFVVKTKQAGGAATERFRVADTTLTDSSGMLKQAAIEQNSATTGQALVWGGSAWAPGSVASFPAGATNTTLRYSDTNTVANTDKFKIDSSGNITADGTITAGSGPTTLTNSSGKVLMSALEKKTYSVMSFTFGYYAFAYGSLTSANGYVYNSSDEACFFTGRTIVPYDYKTGGDIRVTYIWYPTGTGDYVNAVGVTEFAQGASTATPTFTKETITIATANRYYTRTYTYSGISNLVAGDAIAFGFYRYATDAADTSTGGIYLYGYTLEFER